MTQRTTRPRRQRLGVALLLAWVAVGLLGSHTPLVAQGRVDPKLQAIQKKVEIAPNLNAQIPLDLKFKDEDGKDVTLADYFQGKRPVVLTMVYFRCPMLCSLVIHGLVTALQKIDWMPGKEYEVVTVSIDPRDDPPAAKQRKKATIDSFGHPEAAKGWHYLTGQNDQIEPLAKAIGFGYQKVEVDGKQQFAHAAGIFLLSPSGKLTRLMEGITYDPNTLRLSLLEASNGKVGSWTDRIPFLCYHYDDQSGKYILGARQVMRVGCIAILVAVVLVLTVLHLRHGKRKHEEESEGVVT